ncbi:hypothetical protein V8C35DRAFT_179912 [Trichoderma chlorosporum]
MHWIGSFALTSIDGHTERVFTVRNAQLIRTDGINSTIRSITDAKTAAICFVFFWFCLAPHLFCPWPCFDFWTLMSIFFFGGGGGTLSLFIEVLFCPFVVFYWLSLLGDMARGASWIKEKALNFWRVWYMTEHSNMA